MKITPELLAKFQEFVDAGVGAEIQRQHIEGGWLKAFSIDFFVFPERYRAIRKPSQLTAFKKYWAAPEALWEYRPESFDTSDWFCVRPVTDDDE
jgi:hypothetical protein